MGGGGQFGGHNISYVLLCNLFEAQDSNMGWLLNYTGIGHGRFAYMKIYFVEKIIRLKV